MGIKAFLALLIAEFRPLMIIIFLISLGIFQVLSSLKKAS